MMSFSTVQDSITKKLKATLNPSYLDVVNESSRHNVPVDSETHFKVVVVADLFASMKSSIQRHRKINQILAEELAGPVHALSIVAKTPAQWERTGGLVDPSPNCLGGDGSLPKR